MPKHAAHGRIVWHDLVTTDTDAAIAFYEQIAPWHTRPFDDDSGYTMWTLGDTPIGGVMAMSDAVRAGGTPPHWLTFVCVYDVDACTREAVSLGGKIQLGPKEVPYVGCWAVIQDPSGASIGMFEPADTPPGHEGDPVIGEFSWHELMTADYKAAAEFYRALFKWETVSDFDMGEMGVYHMFGQGGQTYGGMFNRRPEMPPPNWLPYIRVADVKPVAAKVTELGGAVLNGPMEVPGGDWIAQCMDPQRAAFALHHK